MIFSIAPENDQLELHALLALRSKVHKASPVGLETFIYWMERRG